MVGTATADSGTKSAYISDDGGTSNTYNSSTNQVSHLYKSFTATQNMNLEFSWKCLGEGPWDNLTVLIVPAAQSITAGSELSGAYRINGFSSYYSGSNIWNNESVNISSLVSNGSSYNLLFTWKNDGSGGSNPPTAVDDIFLTST